MKVYISGPISGCGAESGLYHYESEAIEAWNRRAEPWRGEK